MGKTNIFGAFLFLNFRENIIEECTFRVRETNSEPEGPNPQICTQLQLILFGNVPPTVLPHARNMKFDSTNHYMLCTLSNLRMDDPSSLLHYYALFEG